MKKIILLLLLVLPLTTFSQEKDSYTILSLFNGAIFRPSDFCYSAEASIEEFKSKGLGQQDQGISLNYEYQNRQSYLLGLKYYRTPFLYFPVLYVALQPDYYNNGSESGFNIMPELGFQYDPIWQYVVGLRFKLSYGYDVPVYNREGYGYNRSVIELKVGITFNLKHSTSY